ncbi:MAG: ABC transporter permease [Actinomycetota bacterium]|nr:ABC transporter permease [Actinomycetota bacterium]
MREQKEKLSSETPAVEAPEAELVVDALVGGESIAALSPKQLAWRRFRRHKLAIGSAAILILLTTATIVGPLISKYSFHGLDLLHTNQGPSLRHWFGTDNLGRDEFVRVLYGGRISLTVGLTVALSAGVIGAVIGSVAGFYGRWLDNVLMRFTDLFLAIPFLVILILASQILKAGNIVDIVIILTLFFWMFDARIVRGIFLSMKEKEFVEAARASGASDKRIIFYHMLPNAMGPIIVGVTLGVANAILTESALSFLGFGIRPPTPSWGNLLEEAQSFAIISPYRVWFPGLMILLTALCVNFLGDGLRDALDPHGKVTEVA